MGKRQKKDAADMESTADTTDSSVKVKRTRKSASRDAPSQRSSVYRGVTRHRWTGRYEAHLWDKNCRNESQNKKGKQVYLGAYDDEEAAAHAYDLAALKYWGHGTLLNFPLSKYQEELKEMEGQSREEYIGTLRRKSSGFSRGVSKYRGVARLQAILVNTEFSLVMHHHNGRWEARIGRVLGNKYLYLGTYATQEEAAIAYDRAAIEYRGPNAVTNFDLSRYAKYIQASSSEGSGGDQMANVAASSMSSNSSSVTDDFGHGFFQPQYQQQITEAISQFPAADFAGATASSSAFGLPSQPYKLQNTVAISSSPTSSSSSPLPLPRPPLPLCSSRPSRCSFPEDIQTYFECHVDGGSFAEEEDAIFGDLNPLVSPLFQYELGA